jgi:hypothetical protein
MPREHYSMSDYAHHNEDAAYYYFAESRGDDMYYEPEYDEFDAEPYD